MATQIKETPRASKETSGMDILELQNMTIAELSKLAQGFNIQGYSSLRKQELIFSIIQLQDVKFSDH